jgi:hypothetical protein
MSLSFGAHTRGNNCCLRVNFAHVVLGVTA